MKYRRRNTRGRRRRRTRSKRRSGCSRNIKGGATPGDGTGNKSKLYKSLEKMTPDRRAKELMSKSLFNFQDLMPPPPRPQRTGKSFNYSGKQPAKQTRTTKNSDGVLDRRYQLQKSQADDVTGFTGYSTVLAADKIKAAAVAAKDHDGDEVLLMADK